MFRRAMLVVVTGVLSSTLLTAPVGASPATVTLDVRGPAGSLPVGFLGLSVEASSIRPSGWNGVGAMT